jgi:type IV pilus assembly protein PilE
MCHVTPFHRPGLSMSGCLSGIGGYAARPREEPPPYDPAQSRNLRHWSERMMMMSRRTCSAHAHRALQIGFTLIEVMVTVAILAILSAIAIPIYTNYVARSEVQNGVQGLALARTRMEQYFLDNRTYVNSDDDCGATMPTTDDNPKFEISCEPDNRGTTYLITAAGLDNTSMEGVVYTINQLNARTSNITKAGWDTGGSQPCWITRPGETC